MHMKYSTPEIQAVIIPAEENICQASVGLPAVNEENPGIEIWW